MTTREDAQHSSSAEDDALLAAPKDAVDRPPTPLPIFKMVILSMIQLTEAVMVTQVLPYLPFMIQTLLETTATDPRVGLYTGLLAASFSFSQFFTSHLWGWVSDRIGRRPVILFGILANTLTIPLFGFSSNLAMAFAFRSLNGLANGNIGVLKTYLTEILDSSNQAKGFSIVTLNFSVGLIIGPTIGGALYEVTETGFLGDYPWALPCFVCAGFSFITLIMAFFLLDETYKVEDLKANEDKAKLSRSSSEASSVASDDSFDASKSANSKSSRAKTRATNYGSLANVVAGESFASSSPGMGGSFQDSAASASASSPQMNIVVSVSSSASADFKDGSWESSRHLSGSSPSASEDALLHPPPSSSSGHTYLDKNKQTRFNVASASHASSVIRGDNHTSSGSGSSSGSDSRKDSRSRSRSSNDAEEPEQSDLRYLWNNRDFMNATVIYGVTSFVFIGFQTVFPLWAKVPKSEGGWEWNPTQIGIVQSSASPANVVMQLFLFHRLSKRFGLLRIYRYFWALPLACYFLYPLLGEIDDLASQFVAIIVIMLLLTATGGVVFTVSFMLISNSVYREVLGTANGVAQSSACFARGVGPAIAGALFGWSLDYELAGGWGSQIPLLNRYLMFYVTAFFALLALAWSFRVPSKFNKTMTPKLKKDLESS